MLVIAGVGYYFWSSHQADQLAAQSRVNIQRLLDRQADQIARQRADVDLLTMQYGNIAAAMRELNRRFQTHDERGQAPIVIRQMRGEGSGDTTVIVVRPSPYPSPTVVPSPCDPTPIIGNCPPRSRSLPRRSSSHS